MPIFNFFDISDKNIFAAKLNIFIPTKRINVIFDISIFFLLTINIKINVIK